jgi:hypothetical protein
MRNKLTQKHNNFPLGGLKELNGGIGYQKQGRTVLEKRRLFWSMNLNLLFGAVLGVNVPFSNCATCCILFL